LKILELGNILLVYLISSTRCIFVRFDMRSNRKWGLLGAVLLTTGLAVSAQAQARLSGGAAGPVLASTYDPYTLHRGPCPEGAPWGGKKCDQLLPQSHPRLG
jgi:hypothetical protein